MLIFQFLFLFVCATNVWAAEHTYVPPVAAYNKKEPRITFEPPAAIFNDVAPKEKHTHSDFYKDITNVKL